ncbi:MAG: hypothetical protein M0032_01490 [Actinomycetota bacterium]|nr:hypothetical protein [Actinomycetota bacterium]
METAELEAAEDEDRWFDEAPCCTVAPDDRVVVEVVEVVPRAVVVEVVEVVEVVPRAVAPGDVLCVVGLVALPVGLDEATGTPAATESAASRAAAVAFDWSTTPEAIDP